MSDPQQLKRKNARTAVAALAVVAGMVGFAYASAPLYRLVCKQLGINGTTQVATSAPAHVSEVPVTVRFDANTDPALPWEFKPAKKSVTIKFGESATVSYHAKNLSNHAIAGTATFNVTPEKIGQYFNKIACFCFQETVLQPGEEKDLAVTFYVDPDLLNDKYADEVRTITLSYTFFPSANGLPIESQPKTAAAIVTPATAAQN
jgi:cytochrome c oxidase assembly protein subunit 11